MSLTLSVQPSPTIFGEQIDIPGDKSISHRAIMFSALAEGVSTIRHFLTGEDCLNTMKIFQAMGVQIERMTEDGSILRVHGVGLYGLKEPKGVLDCGNSGTTMRLMMGLLAGQNFKTVLTGDASLQKRPMMRVASPLQSMGASIMLSNQQFAPVTISPADSLLHAIDFHLPIASAQVKSAILLASLYCSPSEITKIIEPSVTRDHSERMLRHFGCEIEQNKGQLLFPCGQKLKARDIDVPSDISSAAFWIVAGLIAKEGKVVLKNIGINPTRADVLKLLQLMGAKLQIDIDSSSLNSSYLPRTNVQLDPNQSELAHLPIMNQQQNQVCNKSGNLSLVNTDDLRMRKVTSLNSMSLHAEPIATITVTPTALEGITFPKEYIAVAIDEMPILMIAAAVAKGTTEIRNAEELRVKESDRIRAMVDGLRILGIDVEEFPDGVRIQGGTLKGGRIKSYGDHRIAMSFAIAAIAAQQEIIIDDCDQIATSFPTFIELGKKLGLKLDAWIGT